MRIAMTIAFALLMNVWWAEYANTLRLIVMTVMPAPQTDALLQQDARKLPLTAMIIMHVRQKPATLLPAVFILM